jgi:prepilin-type N-terminal cleavage/methylation domain-containing protein
MKRAFTLTETIVTVALTSIVMGALAQLYINFNALYVYQQTFVATTNAATSAMSALNASVLQADQVVASHVFSGTTITSGAGALVLELPSMNSSGNVITGVYDYIGFSTTTTTLYQRTDAGAGSARISGSKIVATRVDSITFAYDTADLTQATRVSATTTTKFVSKKGPVTTTLSGQFYLRNK